MDQITCINCDKPGEVLPVSFCCEECAIAWVAAIPSSDTTPSGSSWEEDGDEDDEEDEDYTN